MKDPPLGQLQSTKSQEFLYQTDRKKELDQSYYNATIVKCSFIPHYNL